MVGVSVSVPQDSPNTVNGMRPFNPRTDLSPLADLIELVFADTMDSSGRAALREMRMLSHLGAGLNVLSRLNELTLGIHTGVVWIADQKLVGNVSIYPANWHTDLGNAWIIANVGVHPAYQRRGIARQLMRAGIEMIQQRGGTAAILQVDYDNDGARSLYRQLGFVEERAWSLWRRSGGARPIQSVGNIQVEMSHRRLSEWRAEYALAQQVRPTALGGIGWLRPLHPSLFRPHPLRWLNDLFNLRSIERLVIRTPDERALAAALWVETGISSSSRLTLMVSPQHAGVYDDALLSTIVRRLGHDPLVIEHPHDETVTNTILERHRFSRQRTVIHMRLDTR